MTQLTTRIAIICLLCLAFFSGHSYAANASLDLTHAPDGEVMLTLKGRIGVSNSADPNTLQLDRAMLESLPVTSISTKTPWTKGVSEFTGVRVSDLIKAVEADSTDFSAIALDDYVIDIENVDFERYPIIIAYKINGKPMTLRNLGPLWLMFPFDDHPELLTEVNKAYCVWQLREIHFK